VNDVFDFSEIEARRLALEPRRFRLRQELEGVFAPAAAQAQGKGLEFIRDVASDVPDALVGDPHRLRQILASLLGNAVKFTDRGEVVVHVAVDSRTDEDVVLLWSVADTGVGVPVEQQDAIFDPFGPRDPSRARRGGTGLGLAIASELVTLMGGRIWVESQPEQGSCFRFTARFALQPGAAEETTLAPVPAPAARGRILVAEDNPGNRMVAVRLLERQGFTVVAVENGREALDALAEEPIDLVLMDVAMPEMDGIEATAAIRRVERATGRHLPVVALTAFACAGDRTRCLEAGMDDYVAKPFKSEELMAVVRRFLPAADAAPALAAVERTAHARAEAVAGVGAARSREPQRLDPA
jgi:CheY-like chemotaxis protein